MCERQLDAFSQSANTRHNLWDYTAQNNFSYENGDRYIDEFIIFLLTTIHTLI